MTSFHGLGRQVTRIVPLFMGFLLITVTQLPTATCGFYFKDTWKPEQPPYYTRLVCYCVTLSLTIHSSSMTPTRSISGWNVSPLIPLGPEPSPPTEQNFWTMDLLLLSSLTSVFCAVPERRTSTLKIFLWQPPLYPHPRNLQKIPSSNDRTCSQVPS